MLAPSFHKGPPQNGCGVQTLTAVLLLRPHCTAAIHCYTIIHGYTAIHGYTTSAAIPPSMAIPHLRLYRHPWPNHIYGSFSAQAQNVKAARLRCNPFEKLWDDVLPVEKGPNNFWRRGKLVCELRGNFPRCVRSIEHVSVRMLHGVLVDISTVHSLVCL